MLNATHSARMQPARDRPAQTQSLRRRRNPTLLAWGLLALCLLALRVMRAVTTPHFADWRYFLPIFLSLGGLGCLVAIPASRKGRAVASAALAIWAILGVVAHSYTLRTGLPLRWSDLVVGFSSGFASLALGQEVGAPLLWVGLPLAVAVLYFGNRRGRTAARRRARSLKSTLLLAGAGFSLLLTSRMVEDFEHSEPGIAQDGALSVLFSLTSGSAAHVVDQRTYRLGTVRAPTRRHNVVIVIMESTGWAATSLKGELNTTPFLAQQAGRGIEATNAFVAIPHTSKSVATILCGTPPLDGPFIPESEPDGLTWKCLPKWLAGFGYQTAFFQSATERFENGRQLASNLGFELFVSGDQLATEGFEEVNYFGVEDAVLIEPISKWVADSREPFLLTVLTNTPHHDYRLSKRYAKYDEDPERNSWLNSIRYQDDVIREIVSSIPAKTRERTLFVFVGDHGEAFGEHRRWIHDFVPWREVTQVPFVIRGPGIEPRRVEYPVSQVDIAPTLLEALGALQTKKSAVSRELVAGTCLYRAQCIFAVDEDRYYIHFFRGDEIDVYRSDDVKQLRPEKQNGPEALLRKMRAWRETLGSGRSLLR